MKAPTFDKDGYPTDETLDTIKSWSYSRSNDARMLFNYIRMAWKYDYWQEVDGEIHISTAGWSGNESLISAFRSNVIWIQSRRGGHYTFKDPSTV